MKRILFLVVVGFIFSTFSVNGQVVRDTAFMQANQINDVYYSLKNGTSGNVIRSNWDIGFYTNAFSDGIVTNDGSGVVLYSYPKGDSSAWATVDTIGLSTWKAMYNSDTTWELGAFNKNALGHPDYGWGVYNITTHNLTGDSIFIIKLVDGSFKKLRILKKEAVANKFYIRWANLDGTGQTDAIINCTAYTSKLFLAFSISSNAIVDREPAKADWDLKFTKYMFPGYGPIQGVLTNKGVHVAKLFPKDTAFTGYTTATYDTSHINVIGYSWKSSGVIKDSLLYFIKDQKGNIFKFVFEHYSTPTGKIGFRKAILYNVGFEDQTNNAIGSAVVYPNPATNYINLVVDLLENSEMKVNIVDMSGRIVMSSNLGNVPVGFHNIPFNTENLTKGLYYLQIQSNDSQKTLKFIKN